jgi:hypothetical protein
MMVAGCYHCGLLSLAPALIFLGVVTAQQSTPLSDLPDPQNLTQLCPWDTLNTRIRRAQAACNSTSTCSIQCATEVVPLYSECRSLLDRLYDIDDGSEDGIAAAIAQAVALCLKTVSPTQAMRKLIQLHEASPERCSLSMLNDLGRTSVRPPPCADKNPKCQTALSVGVWTCKTAHGNCDKTCKVCGACEDKNKQCAQALKFGVWTCKTAKGNCDKTCKTCGASGGGAHRRRRRRRRVQSKGHASKCQLSTYNKEADEINRVCCDDSSCKHGVPKACDLKCATHYIGFYERCSHLLRALNGEKTAIAMKHLYSTCAWEIPVDATVKAIAKCNTKVCLPVHLSRCTEMRTQYMIEPADTRTAAGERLKNLTTALLRRWNQGLQRAVRQG